MEPPQGSVAYTEQQTAADYGVPSFVVADAEWIKNKGNTPAFSAGGQIYFRETMPEKNRGMYATHEITHVMKQVGYTPYLDFVSKTPDMLDMSTLEARILLEHTAKHSGIDPFNTSLSETDRLNLYDELNATLYGHISSGNMRGLNEVLNTAFYDFSAYTRELNELHERFKADNQKKWKEKTRYSLKDYSDAEQRDHRKKAIAFFGKTYNWNETGYLTPAGTKLDFSGRHEGGPGGYRTVDHRDIRDAIGEDYGSETKDIEITGVLQNLYSFNPRICRWLHFRSTPPSVPEAGQKSPSGSAPAEGQAPSTTPPAAGRQDPARQRSNHISDCPLPCWNCRGRPTRKLP